jgi:ABC-type Zn2+ transport system substrate-binding protein/surface adhesin
MKESKTSSKKAIEHVLEIERVKKEADRLMINKVEYYEREINELKNKIADLEDAVKGKDYFHDHDYQYLIDENRKLEQERNELLTDNKKLASQIEDKIDQLRKSGVI